MFGLIVAGLVGAVLFSSTHYIIKETKVSDAPEKIMLPSEDFDDKSEDSDNNLKTEQDISSINNEKSLAIKNEIKNKEALILTFKRPCPEEKIKKETEANNFKKQLISCGCIINSCVFEHNGGYRGYGIYYDNYFVIKVLADANAIKKLKQARIS